MKKIILILLSAFSVTVFAKRTYQVDFDLTYQGQKMQPQSLNLEDGVSKEYRGLLGDKNVSIEIVANSKLKNTVEVTTKITEINSQNEKTIVSNPRILTMIGEEAEIEVGTEESQEPNLIFKVLVR